MVYVVPTTADLTPHTPLVKAEYLFVKADKLRQVANKFVRSLNEPVMISNVQVGCVVSDVWCMTVVFVVSLNTCS